MLPNLSLIHPEGSVVEHLPINAQEKGWQEITLPAEGLAAGMYFLLLRSGAQMLSRKVMLVR